MLGRTIIRSAVWDTSGAKLAPVNAGPIRWPIDWDQAVNQCPRSWSSRSFARAIEESDRTTTRGRTSNQCAVRRIDGLLWGLARRPDGSGATRRGLAGSCPAVSPSCGNRPTRRAVGRIVSSGEKGDGQRTRRLLAAPPRSSGSTGGSELASTRSPRASGRTRAPRGMRSSARCRPARGRRSPGGRSPPRAARARGTSGSTGRWPAGCWHSARSAAAPRSRWPEA